MDEESAPVSPSDYDHGLPPFPHFWNQFSHIKVHLPSPNPPIFCQIFSYPINLPNVHYSAQLTRQFARNWLGETLILGTRDSGNFISRVGDMDVIPLCIFVRQNMSLLDSHSWIRGVPALVKRKSGELPDWDPSIETLIGYKII